MRALGTKATAAPARASGRTAKATKRFSLYNSWFRDRSAIVAIALAVVGFVLAACSSEPAPSCVVEPRERPAVAGQHWIDTPTRSGR